MKFSHPKMNVEHIKVIFEESGNSMTSVSNKNDNARNNMHIIEIKKRFLVKLLENIMISL